MIKFKYIPYSLLLFLCLFFISGAPVAQGKAKARSSGTTDAPKSKTVLLYGQASYYAAKFEGRKTATGEIFRHGNATAACNVLPLGTWVKVTNLRNGRSVIVRTNDRLHPKTKRIIDLGKTSAQKLGYVKQGLTRVKIEVLKKKPK